MSRIPDPLRDDVVRSIDDAMKNGIANITTLVNDITMRHGTEGVSRKELEEMILMLALREGRAVEFGGVAEVSAVPEGYRVIEIEIIQEPSTIM